MIIPGVVLPCSIRIAVLFPLDQNYTIKSIGACAWVCASERASMLLKVEFYQLASESQRYIIFMEFPISNLLFRCITEFILHSVQCRNDILSMYYIANECRQASDLISMFNFTQLNNNRSILDVRVRASDRKRRRIKETEEMQSKR